MQERKNVRGMLSSECQGANAAWITDWIKWAEMSMKYIFVLSLQFVYIWAEERLIMQSCDAVALQSIYWIIAWGEDLNPE